MSDKRSTDSADSSNLVFCRNTTIEIVRKIIQYCISLQGTDQLNAYLSLYKVNLHDEILSCFYKNTNDSYFLIRQACLESFIVWNETVAEDEIVRLLDDSNELVRAYAALAIGKLRFYHLVPLLEKALTNTEEEEEARILFSLCFLGEYKYFPKFINLLKHDYYRVRCAAARMIVDLVTDKNMSFIISFLHFCLKNDPEISSRSSLEYAIQTIKTRRDKSSPLPMGTGEYTLHNKVPTEPPPSNAEFEEMVSVANDCIRSLIQMSKASNDHTRLEIFSSLLEVDLHNEIMDCFNSGLKSKDRSIRLLSLKAVAKWKDLHSKSNVLDLTEDHDDVVRCEAVLTLGVLQVKEHIPDIAEKADCLPEQEQPYYFCALYLLGQHEFLIPLLNGLTSKSSSARSSTIYLIKIIANEMNFELIINALECAASLDYACASRPEYLRLIESLKDAKFSSKSTSTDTISLYPLDIRQ